MKLIYLKLCNFRQFYGQTPEIQLAAGQGNTTVIHGNNGAGKTTILNAFTWILYEKFTAAFASPELLVNKRAITEANFGSSVECWGELVFAHEHKLYQLKRKCYAHKDRNDLIQHSKSQLFMLLAGDDGSWYHPTEQPEDIIEKILPQSLHQYFFFDGERIDHIFRSGQKNNIAEDTKELLGVKVLDRAIDHLKKAKKTLQDELKAIGDLETKQLLKEQKQQEQEKDKSTKRREEILTEIEHQEILKRAINSRLLELGGVEELQQLKQTLEEQEVSKREKLIKSKDKLNQIISSRGHLVCLSDAVHEFKQLVDELREKGELPSGIKQQFVQQLLERKSCICGTELITGTEAHQQVEYWMNRAGMADVEEGAIRLETEVNKVNQQVENFWQEVDTEQANIQQLRIELAQIENQLDDLKKKFRDYPDENIQEIQNRLDAVETAIKDLILEQGGNQQNIEILDKKIAEISRIIAKQQMKEDKQIIAQKRIKVTEEAIGRITEVRNRLERQFRYSLEKKVQEIFSSISFTPYIPRLNDNYELNLIENTSGIAVPVAASTGENQILSLSFIGGIIDRVREWSHKNTLMGIDSSTFPIVMDSPFGSLDEIYRRQVARSIPQLANQLIILVTKTQWRQEVETEMSNYMNKEYVLVYHSSKEDCEEDSIEINQVNYPLVQRSLNQFEYTEILEIPQSKTP